MLKKIFNRELIVYFICGMLAVLVNYAVFWIALRILGQERVLTVNVIAFGFKYGIPLEADLVLDVRFLPNPYYQEELKNLSGLDQPVFDYVMNHPDTAEYMEKLTAFLDFQLPRFREEGKPSLTVAVGCTGGRHRSISVARALTEHLLERGQNARLICRDMGRITDNG